MCVCKNRRCCIFGPRPCWPMISSRANSCRGRSRLGASRKRREERHLTVTRHESNCLRKPERPFDCRVDFCGLDIAKPIPKWQRPDQGRGYKRRLPLLRIIVKMLGGLFSILKQAHSHMFDTSWIHDLHAFPEMSKTYGATIHQCA